MKTLRVGIGLLLVELLFIASVSEPLAGQLPPSVGAATSTGAPVDAQTCKAINSIIQALTGDPVWFKQPYSEPEVRRLREQLASCPADNIAGSWEGPTGCMTLEQRAKFASGKIVYPNGNEGRLTGAIYVNSYVFTWYNGADAGQGELNLVGDTLTGRYTNNALTDSGDVSFKKRAEACEPESKPLPVGSDCYEECYTPCRRTGFFPNWRTDEATCKQQCAPYQGLTQNKTSQGALNAIAACQDLLKK